MTRIAVVLSTLLLAACITPADLDDRWEDPENIQFAPSLDIDLTQTCSAGQITGCWNRTNSGLFWKNLAIGTGPVATAGDSARVRLSGWLPDGSVIEIGTDSGKFPLGIGLLIKGVDEGLLGMQTGGKRKLVIRPSLAYGRLGKGDIPPLATLVYEVDLLWLRPN